MNMRKAVTASLVAGAVSLAAMGAHNANAAADGKEKCYGVVKAGHNDCGDAAGKHSCMGHATTDGSGGDFVALPTGVCEKLVGGTLEPSDKQGTKSEDKKG